MQQQLTQRLADLRVEFEKGQKRLQEMEAEVGAVRNTLLRMSGAIQVLEEEIERYAHQNGAVTAEEAVAKTVKS